MIEDMIKIWGVISLITAVAWGLWTLFIRKKIEKKQTGTIEGKTDWGNLPKGIIGWFLWSIPKNKWRTAVWMISIFAAITAIVAFYLLSNIRVSQITKDRYEIEQTRTRIFVEQWERSEDKEWKIALLNIWSEPTDIPKEIWSEMVLHNDVDARIAAAGHFWVPEFWLDKLNKDPEIRVRLAAILNTVDKNKLINNLAKDDHPSLRKVVAGNINTPVNILKEFEKDEDPEVRLALAGNSFTPKETLKVLAKDKSEENMRIRMAVARNPNTPLEVLWELAEDHTLEYPFGRKPKIGVNPKTEGKITIIIKTDWGIIRREVALNSNVSPGLLERLAEDKSPQVRSGVASNENTPVGLLEKLALDDSSLVRGSVARNPNTPENILVKLFDDEKYVVRLSLARNRIIPVTLLRKLSRDEEVRVRLAVAKNSRTPDEILKKLAEDKKLKSKGRGFIEGVIADNPGASTELRNSVAAANARKIASINPRTPEKTLIELAQDTDYNIRLAVAGNSGSPISVLKRLAQDGRSNVRQRVAGNKKTPMSILKKLALDKVETVCSAALEEIISRPEFELKNPL